MADRIVPGVFLPVRRAVQQRAKRDIATILSKNHASLPSRRPSLRRVNIVALSVHALLVSGNYMFLFHYFYDEISRLIRQETHVHK
ncbi:hypothetical protein [Rugamonas rubra]|uniref:hypothetical protein n=1 Tax=Rugamonas rubra TaxID=758825 RepID=UPI00111415B2|nr:hypothetical protein [Rugamonas rubra]